MTTSLAYEEVERDALLAGEFALIGFTRGLTEELCERLRDVAQRQPSSPWLHRMLMEARKAP